MQRRKVDISEKGMDEEVHGFATSDKNVPPINAMARHDQPYAYNGSEKPWPKALMQKNKNDIGENGIDEEVHGFVKAEKNTSPINVMEKLPEPYPMNGYGRKDALM